MQAATVCFSTPLSFKGATTLVPRRTSNLPRTCIRSKAVSISATAEEIDYSSPTSVFPVEACDIIGGEACNAKMFPEAKLAATPSSENPKVALEEIERSYLEYNEPKTVFPGEACDDLGGEFCEAEYQAGVF